MLKYLDDGGALLDADAEVAADHVPEPVGILHEDVVVEVVLGVDGRGLFEADRAAEHRQRRVARLVHADPHQHHDAEGDEEEDDGELQQPLKDVAHANPV